MSDNNFNQPDIAGNISKEEYIQQLIRVNQAGEFGAKRIYQGQLAIIKDKKLRSIIEHMAEQEKEHLEYFSDQLTKNNIRPTALYPLWNVAGYALGAATAIMGEKAAMACTVAVEEVIDEHYKEQCETLSNDQDINKNSANQKELVDKITKFRQDELEHRQTGLDNGAEQTPFYEALSFAVKNASKLAIFLSKKI